MEDALVTKYEEVGGDPFLVTGDEVPWRVLDTVALIVVSPVYLSTLQQR